MKTLQLFRQGLQVVPTTTAWYLAELGQALGKQELFTRQAPQKLKRLREHALVESAVSSNRIEGVEVEHSRINTLVFGKAPFFDRNEEELRGYRKALEWIHGDHAHIPFDESTVLRLHQLCRGEIWDAGKYKSRDGDIIEQYPDGRVRVRFKTVPAAETQAHMTELSNLGSLRRHAPASRGQDAEHSSRHRSKSRPLHRGRIAARLPGRQHGFDPQNAQGPAKRRQGPLHGPRPSRHLAQGR